MSRADSDQWQDICSRGGGRVERQRNQRRDGSCSKAIRHQRLVSFCPPVCGASHLRVHLNDKLAVAKPRDTKPSKNTHPVTHWCGLRLREKYENATVRSSPGNRLMIFRWNISMSDSGGIGRTSWPKCGKALKNPTNHGGRYCPSMRLLELGSEGSGLAVPSSTLDIAQSRRGLGLQGTRGARLLGQGLTTHHKASPPARAVSRVSSSRDRHGGSPRNSSCDGRPEPGGRKARQER